MRARDLGNPSKVSQESATVTVRVERNRNCPQFESVPSESNIDETLPENGEVLRATAADFDTAVSWTGVYTNISFDTVAGLVKVYTVIVPEFLKNLLNILYYHL